jgi:hypothetical protein
MNILILETGVGAVLKTGNVVFSKTLLNKN